jgi:hypothetical protein
MAQERIPTTASPDDGAERGLARQLVSLGVAEFSDAGKPRFEPGTSACACGVHLTDL